MNKIKIKAYSNSVLKYEYFISVDDWYNSKCKVTLNDSAKTVKEFILDF